MQSPELNSIKNLSQDLIITVTKYFSSSLTKLELSQKRLDFSIRKCAELAQTHPNRLAAVIVMEKWFCKVLTQKD